MATTTPAASVRGIDLPPDLHRREVRAALDELDRTRRCYDAIAELLTPCGRDDNSHLVSSGNLATLMEVLNARLGSELNRANEHYRLAEVA